MRNMGRWIVGLLIVMVVLMFLFVWPGLCRYEKLPDAFPGDQQDYRHD